MLLHYREAQHNDLTHLIDLLSDDVLGAQREDNSKPIHAAYTEAFAEIQKDPNNALIVVELNGDIVGMLQLTFIPYLNRLGSKRCLIEGVRIKKDRRGKGLGEQVFTWAINRAREKGCALVQLTSDKQRVDAVRFYEKLGFEASHEGLKKYL